MKYVKFLKQSGDDKTNLIANVGDMIPVKEFNDEELGKCYSFTVNNQKYCLPEKYNNGQFDIIEKED